MVRIHNKNKNDQKCDREKEKEEGEGERMQKNVRKNIHEEVLGQ